MIIGLTGSLAAGKGVIVDYLQSLGFRYFSLSNEVREEAKYRGIELKREKLQDLGNRLREKYGDAVLASRALRKLDPSHNYIIDGIRNPSEVVELKKQKNKDFFLISVDAPQKLRFIRIIARNRESDPDTWEDFLRIDEIDQGKDQHQSGQQVGACMSHADFSVYNDGDIGAVAEKVKEIITQIETRSNKKIKKNF